MRIIKLGQLICIVVIICLSYSCKKQTDITGLWVGAYNLKNDSTISVPSVKPLVSIVDQSLTYRTIGKLDGILETTDSLTTDYLLKNNVLSLDKFRKDISISFYSKDSIVASYVNETKNKVIFKRIIEKNDIKTWNPIGNQYEYIGNNGKANRIFFKNDSQCIEFNSEKKSFRVKEWEGINFKQQQFLTINNGISSVIMHLDSTETSTAYLSEYSGARSYGFKKVLEDSNNDSNLYGVWHLNEVNSAESVKGFLNMKTPQKIKIQRDSLEFGENDDLTESKYVISGFNNLIILLPTEKILGLPDVWMINELTKNELVLEFYSEYGISIHKIKYSRGH